MKHALIFAVCSFATGATAGHELDDRDLIDGQTLYVEECASCHGANLEGQPNWRTPDANGVLPAPPHDASGHTWHHDNQLLFEYICGYCPMQGRTHTAGNGGAVLKRCKLVLQCRFKCGPDCIVAADKGEGGLLLGKRDRHLVGSADWCTDVVQIANFENPGTQRKAVISQDDRCTTLVPKF